MAKKRVRKESKKRKKKWEVGKDTLPRILLGEYVDAILAWGKRPAEDIVPCELRRAGIALVDFVLDKTHSMNGGDRLNRHKALLDAWSEAKGFFDFAHSLLRKKRDKHTDGMTRGKAWDALGEGLKDGEVAEKLIEEGVMSYNTNAKTVPRENIARMRRDIAKKADAADHLFLMEFDSCFREQHKGEAEILLSRLKSYWANKVVESSQEPAAAIHSAEVYGIERLVPKSACVPPYEFPLTGPTGKIYYEESDLENIDFAERLGLEKFEFTKEKDGGYRSPIMDILHGSGLGTIRPKKI